MTPVLLPLYAAAILILVAAIVLGVKQRQRLGARASNRLVAGAGVLLLAEAMTALRPWLVAQQDGVQADQLNLSIALIALQAALHAIGLALIIAAALTPHATSPASTDKSSD